MVVDSKFYARNMLVTHWFLLATYGELILSNTVLDWMNLHGLSKPSIVAFLNSQTENKPFLHPHGSDDIEQNFDMSLDPLCVVLKSFAWYFNDPSVEGMLSHNVGWVSDAHSVPQDGPLTWHDAEQITVYCCYKGSASDLIALAHEFGHALQLVHLNGRFSPPVDREICAFLGEHILLSYCEAHHPKLYPALAKVWHGEDKIYLGQDADILKSALDDPQASYAFRHNYPVARLAAHDLFAQMSAPGVLNIFMGHPGLSECTALHRKNLEHVA